MYIIQTYNLLKTELNPTANFYISLISFLSLKQYYNVTMYCNVHAYETFIKYIPYDNIIIRDYNNNNVPYKLNVFNEIDVPFIHVDINITIFSNIFKQYVDNNFDILVKCINHKNSFGPQFFVNNNKEFLIKNNIYSIYNNKYFNTEIIGMSTSFKNKYIDNFFKLFNENNYNNNINIPYGYDELIYDELLTYITYINNNFTCYDILSREHDYNILSNEQFDKKYEHFDMYLDDSLMSNNEFIYKYYYIFNINDIKLDIKNRFSQHYNLIENFELKNKHTIK